MLHGLPQIQILISLLVSYLDMFPSLSTATDLSTRRAFANPPPAAATAVPASPPAPALDAAAQQVADTSFFFIMKSNLQI